MNGAFNIGPHEASAIMPMHLVVGADGRIIGAGPVMRRLLGDAQHFHDILATDQQLAGAANSVDPLAELRRNRRATLHVRGQDQLVLRGHGVALAGDALLLNFGFGMSLPQAIKLLSLTEADFSPSSNVIELLFMYEASQAILGEISRANEALESARHEAERMSLTDPLTGLLNRRGFELEFRKLVYPGNARQPAVAVLDLDLFKHINDRFGHAAGDEVLIAVGDALRSGVRRGDVVARAGGDEFLLLFSQYDLVSDLVGIIERIIERIEEPISLENGIAKLSASAGVSTFQSGAEADMSEVLGRADSALYQVKSAGGGRVVLAGPE